MKISELESEVDDLKKILKPNEDNVNISIDGYTFAANSVADYGDGMTIISDSKYPCNRYRFTYMMFDPETKKFRGITHRTFCASSDNEVINNLADYIPGWEDTEYKMLRVERVLDDSVEIYKQIWEYSGN